MNDNKQKEFFKTVPQNSQVNIVRGLFKNILDTRKKQFFLLGLAIFMLLLAPVLFYLNKGPLNKTQPEYIAEPKSTNYKEWINQEINKVNLKNLPQDMTNVERSDLYATKISLYILNNDVDAAIKIFEEQKMITDERFNISIEDLTVISDYYLVNDITLAKKVLEKAISQIDNSIKEINGDLTAQDIADLNNQKTILEQRLKGIK